jgi:hypothetical protein
VFLGFARAVGFHVVRKADWSPAKTCPNALACGRILADMLGNEIFVLGHEAFYPGMTFCTWVWKFLPGYDTFYLGMKLSTRVWNFVPVYNILYPGEKTCEKLHLTCHSGLCDFIGLHTVKVTLGLCTVGNRSESRHIPIVRCYFRCMYLPRAPRSWKESMEATCTYRVSTC